MAKQRSILEQVVGAGGSMPTSLARYLLTLDFPKSVHRRYERLSEKAQRGELNDEDRAVLDEYLAADAWLSILQAKAKRSLKRRTRAA